MWMFSHYNLKCTCSRSYALAVDQSPSRSRYRSRSSFVLMSHKDSSGHVRPPVGGTPPTKGILIVSEISPTGKSHTASVTEQVTPDSSSDAAKKSRQEKPTERECTASTGGGRPSELDVGAKKVQSVKFLQ